MNTPVTLMIVWQILALILLFFIVRFIYRYVKRKNREWGIKNKGSHLLLLLLILGTSCKKENTEQRSELLEQLGITNYTIEKSTTAKPISFSDLKTLQTFLSVVRQKEGTPYHGNTTTPKQLKKSINESFIMAWLNKSPSARHEEEEEEDDDYKEWYTSGSGGSPGDGTPSLNKWYGWTGYNVTFSYKNTDGKNEVTDFNSGLVGIHLWVGWEHQSGSGVLNQSTGIISFTVQGIQSYNIIFQGIGTLFSTPVELVGSFNINTGEYTITIRYPRQKGIQK